MPPSFLDQINSNCPSRGKPLAFITGATGGIGSKAAQLFSEKGYALWLAGRDKERLKEIAQQYDTYRYTAADFTRPKHVKALCSVISNSDHPISIAFLNAGMIKPGSLIDLSYDDIETHFNVNLIAASHLNKAVAKRMIVEKNGHIINNLSTSAFVSLPVSAPYSATKFGLRGLLTALRGELAPYNISMTSLYSNAVDTPMLEYEAKNGGTPLNFLKPPLSVDDIIHVLDRALIEKKESYFIPKGDGFLARLIAIFPSIVRMRYQKWSKIGEKGRKDYLDKKTPKLD